MRSLKSPPNLHLYAAGVLEKLSSAEAKQVSRHGAKINLVLCASLYKNTHRRAWYYPRRVLYVLLIALLCMREEKEACLPASTNAQQMLFLCLHAWAFHRLRPASEVRFLLSGYAMRGIGLCLR